MPDFLGYILIVIGIGNLENRYETKECSMFGREKSIGALLVVTSTL